MRINNKLAALLLASVFMAGVAHGEDRVWVVGGGQALKNSQASIELNVKWIDEIFRKHADESKINLYFADGNDPAPDVIAWRRANESMEMLQPLARVYGMQINNGDTYHTNAVRNVKGDTREGALTRDLSNAFGEVPPGDRVFFIFNGHGTFNSGDTSKNALRLWGDTLMTAQELEELVSKIDPRVSVRLFLPQCYSGGFARIVYPGAKKAGELVPHNRCAFMAVSDDKEAEGCTSGVNVGDYRDYSTYFFGALSGQGRNGERLESKPDLDMNGTVSLLEAHYYSLINAESTDIPRTTSEQYLEDWEPWYLRWLIGARAPDNVYARLAVMLSDKLDLSGDWTKVVTHIRERYTQLQENLSTLGREQVNVRQQAEEIQKNIRDQLEALWPGASNPHTYLYMQFMRNDVSAAQEFIMANPEYNNLVKLQDRDFELDAEILSVERDITQLDKILRLRRLADILEAFQRIADSQSRSEYGRLVACESTNPW